MEGLDLGMLLPNFAAITAADVDILQWLNGVAGAVLLLIFVSAIGYVAWRRSKSSQQVRAIRSLLKGQQVENLAENRRELNNAAKNLARETCGIWLEYDEALVETGDPQRLYNTYDAAHFFNSRNLAQGLVENRLLAAVPGVLTAIGVLGTFLGLTFGLSGINLATNASIEDIRTSIGTMISSANVAFMTSVWGVFSSVVFNMFEKACEGSAVKSIKRLQDEIDRLYPRHTAEKILVDIEDHGRESRKTLQGLAEQIGSRMQEALRENSQVIADQLNASLTNTLGPAISKLVDNANEGSEKAIEGLLEKFLDSMGDVGEGQRKLLDQASADFSSSASEVRGEFTALVESMQSIQSQQSEAQKQLYESSQEASRSLGAEFDSTVSALSSEFAKVGALQNQLSRTVEAASAANAASSSTLVEDVRLMSSELAEVAVSSKSNGEELARSAVAMKDAVAEMHGFAATIRDVSVSLRDDFTQMTATAKSLALQNQNISQQLTGAMHSIKETQDYSAATTASLKEITSDASSGMQELKSHLTDYADKINNHVNSLESQLESMLSDYGERVEGQTHERLEQWNEQTSKYTSLMTDAIHALSGVVDDIESRVA